MTDGNDLVWCIFLVLFVGTVAFAVLSPLKISMNGLRIIARSRNLSHSKSISKHGLRILARTRNLTYV